MTTTRREFLSSAAGISILGGSAVSAMADLSADTSEPPTRKLNILILGGTVFLGPHIVEAALERKHNVTLFNRGMTNPDLFPKLETLIGNRDPDIEEGLEALKGRDWDAVIDTSAYVPRIARASATMLADRVKQYVFISSVSVYADNSIPYMDESAAVGKLDDETTEEITGETYGPLKALCEQACEEVLPGRVTTIRPGLIVGPLDPSDRFTYWPVRIHRGGEVLAPAPGTDPVQYIDARDLAAFVVRTIETGAKGLFNAVTPAGQFTMAGMLHGIRASQSTNATFTWVDREFLDEHNVQPWSDLPAWVPPIEGYEGFALMKSKAAADAGLKFRPLADTARDTLNWFLKLPEDRRQNLRTGLSQERESEILSAWHAREETSDD